MKRSITQVIRLLVLLVAAINAAAAWSATFREGDAAYQEGDFGRAYAVMHTLANLGDARAQANIALMYRSGKGVKQDYAEAVKWYRLAAEQGDAGGQFGLGFCYEEGQGVARDYLQALQWYRAMPMRK
jgi:uncharacterized protein